MKYSRAVISGLGAIAAVLLAGCAAAPEKGDTPAVAVATANCKFADAPTGSSIQRRDCSSNPDVQTADPRELMDSKRLAMPPLAR